MRTTRRLLAAAAVALLVAACTPEGPQTIPPVVVTPDADAPAGGAADDEGTASDTTDEQPGDAPPAAPDDAEQADQGGDSGAAAPPADEEPAPADTAPPADEQPPALTEVVDGGPVGANAPAYLRGDRPRVVIELDVLDGASLPQSAIDHVRSVLDRESASAVEVVVDGAGTARETWTLAQLREAAAANRSIRHDDTTAVLHVLVVPGSYEDDGVLGLAFGSSSAVVFPDQWSGLTTALLSGDRIARAVTTHEVGHLLGLVGLYEEPATNHEDPEHPGHSSDPDDVMYWAVERDVISQLDGIPTDFGPGSRADLAAIREG